MNRSQSNELFRLRRYLHFLRHSTTRHGIHSPYLYKLVEEVIRPGAPEGLCAPVEALRDSYRRAGREVILKTDYGAGAGGQGLKQYPVTLRRLASVSASPAYRAARLFRLVRFIGAQTILELGTSLGLSAAYMGKANPGARIITLEGCPALADLARNNFARLGLDNITVVQGDFNETLPGVLQQMAMADLVFFDGDHRLEPTRKYFRLCLEKAGNDSVFVFDDIHYSKDMEQAWEEVRSNERVTVSLDMFYTGMLLFRKELSRQHFVLRYP